jgi:hypothetical protein
MKAAERVGDECRRSVPSVGLLMTVLTVDGSAAEGRLDTAHAVFAYMTAGTFHAAIAKGGAIRTIQIAACLQADVRFGSLADTERSRRDVRFTPESCRGTR